MEKPQRWSDEEIEALKRLTQTGRFDSSVIQEVFPHRNPSSVRRKFRAMREIDPDNWKLPKSYRPINWHFIELLEKECEESRSSEIRTSGHHLV